MQNFSSRKFRHWTICFILIAGGTFFLVQLLNQKPDYRYFIQNASVQEEIVSWNSPKACRAILDQTEQYLTENSSPIAEKTALDGLKNLGLKFTDTEIASFRNKSDFPERWSCLVDQKQEIGFDENLIQSDWQFTKQVLNDLMEEKSCSDTGLTEAEHFLEQITSGTDLRPDHCWLILSHSVLPPTNKTAVSADTPRQSSADRSSAISDPNFSGSFPFLSRNPLNRIAFFSQEEITAVENGGWIFEVQSPAGLLSVLLLLLFSVPDILPAETVFGWFAALENIAVRMLSLNYSENTLLFSNRERFEDRSRMSLVWADTKRLLI